MLRSWLVDYSGAISLFNPIRHLYHKFACGSYSEAELCQVRIAVDRRGSDRTSRTTEGGYADDFASKRSSADVSNFRFDTHGHSRYRQNRRPEDAYLSPGAGR